MPNIRNFTVLPALPSPLKPLRDLAYNLWWTWNPDATDLFRRLDYDLWEEVNHNPVMLLGRIGQDRLEKAAQDPAFRAYMDRVLASFEAYRTGDTWFTHHFGSESLGVVAYFSAEFGLHECLPIYSGGLGVLAGDHLKSASDLGLPVTAIGLMYRQGYFHQFLTNDGYQFEEFPDLDFAMIPIVHLRDDDGKPLRVAVEMQGRNIVARLWRVQVGRVPLTLLDANVPENRPEDREITARLYGGDEEMRIRQEILLGIGGVRALEAIGVEPAAYHMNEGHSAFLGLERIRRRMESEDLSFDEAREAVAAGTVFTTHTPVPAGIDTFPSDLVEKYLGDYCGSLGKTVEDLLSLSRMNPGDPHEPFCMAVLALRLSDHCNGVSQLHGTVSREIFHKVWPAVPVDEVPIRAITNGVHIRSWVAIDMAHLLDRYLGPDWLENPTDQEVWDRVDLIPDAELWRAHDRLRERLVVQVRRRLKAQLRSRGAPPAEIDRADEVLDPEALTIGFARRFAPYKRATLFLQNPERLIKILTDPQRPVQFVVSGKAHPKDEAGKELIKRVVDFAKDPRVRPRIVFIEDYDMSVARTLVAGVDVWLNTPIKKHEASGTSGMKVPANGGINMSVLDGWWSEAADGENGWIVGDNREYNNDAYQNFVESESIYALLEQEIVPRFYERGTDGLPRGWIAKIKASMRTIPPRFNSNRMLLEYWQNLYLPAVRRWRQLSENGFETARQLAAWRARLGEKWNEVRAEGVSADGPPELIVGNELPVTAQIHLGSIEPNEVAVELYYGPLSPSGHLQGGQAVTLKCVENGKNGTYRYAGAIPCQSSGEHGYAVRIVPYHPQMPSRYQLGLIRWG